jgi:mannose-6-phosphate isomerase-like protein (cupin superfamily)
MAPSLVCDLDRLQRGVTDAWRSFDVATVNGNAVRCRIMENVTSSWHIHETSDELFHVISGTVHLDTEHTTHELVPGQLFVVPAGTRHSPRRSPSARLERYSSCFVLALRACSNRDNSTEDAMTTETSADRTEEGRFAPGHSGNPAGRPKGSRNRASLLDAMLREGEAEVLVRRYIERALGGDMVAIRVLFRALVPAAKGRAIELDVEEPGADEVAAYDAALREVARGAVTLDEASQFSRLLAARQAAAARQGAAAAAAARTAAAKPEPSPVAPMNRHERRRLAALFGGKAHGIDGACISPVLSGTAPNSSPLAGEEGAHAAGMGG